MKSIKFDRHMLGNLSDIKRYYEQMFHLYRIFKGKRSFPLKFPFNDMEQKFGMNLEQINEMMFVLDHAGYIDSYDTHYGLVYGFELSPKFYRLFGDEKFCRKKNLSKYSR